MDPCCVLVLVSEMDKVMERTRREALAVVKSRLELVSKLGGTSKMELLCTTYRSIVMALDAKTAVKFVRVAGVSDADPLAVTEDPARPDTDAFRISATVAGHVASCALHSLNFLAPEYVPVLATCDRRLCERAAAVPMRRFATTLAAELAARRWFSGDEVVRLVRRLHHAVSKAHAAGHQHGDLRPAQVLMDPDPDTAVVTDWSLSFVVDHIPAPRGPYDPPASAAWPMSGIDADRWALGCIILDVLAGRAEALCADVPADVVVTQADRTRAITARTSGAGDDAAWLGCALRGLLTPEQVAERATQCTEAVALARTLLSECPSQ